VPHQFREPRQLAGGPLSVVADDLVGLLLVGGKGGVGKTTTAAALAVHLAERFPERRCLVVSTGPSHLLSGVLGASLGAVPQPVPGTANLLGLEIDATTLLRVFKTRHGPALRMILGRGTYLDEQDISGFLELSFPGLDELMAMLELINLMKSGDYDSIVVDTAPTGHTLRLLGLPVLAAAWVSMLDRMLEKHRFMSKVFSRRYRRDEADEFIDKLNQDLSRLTAVLRDPQQCRFLVVTLPEPVVIAETLRLLDALRQRGMAVACLVFNRLLESGGRCPVCCSRWRSQWKMLGALAEGQPNLPIAVLPDTEDEIRGASALAAFLDSASAVGDPPPARSACPDPEQLEPSALPLPEAGREVFLFCGKGGVGKTTLSCAFALQLSRTFPERRILLFSTDPAHSLSDCLAQKIRPEDTAIDGARNLFAREIDPEILFGAWKQAYSHEIESAFAGLSSPNGVEVQFDREVMAGLLDLTPPGLDELMCLAALADEIERKAYDFYVLDTAPGGHTVRFLELPTVIRDWLHTIFNILLKYRRLVRLPEVSDALIGMSRRIKKIQQVFRSPDLCEAITVTTPAQAAREESERLVSALQGAGIRTRQMLVNQVSAPSGSCRRCDLAARQQAQELRQLRDSFPDMEITAFPRLAGELRGTENLTRLLRFTYAEELAPVEALQ
jgi:arsenite/tail-anchored protein-transporting ATPase